MATHRCVSARLAVARLAVALLAAFLLAPLAAAQPWQLCGTSGNYSANDTYQSNLGLLSATLPKNASASRTLFATDSVGSVPNIAYALALCRGDINASACEACVTTAFQDAQQICAFNKEATVFYDLCLLRFSNQNFLNTTNDNNFIIAKNPQNVSAPAEVFDSAVTILLNATSNYAAANSSRRFATGEEAFASSNPTIYGLGRTKDTLLSSERIQAERLENWLYNYHKQIRNTSALGKERIGNLWDFSGLLSEILFDFP